MLANDRQRPGRAAAERPAEDDLPGSLDQIGQEPCLASAFQQVVANNRQAVVLLEYRLRVPGRFR